MSTFCIDGSLDVITTFFDQILKKVLSFRTEIALRICLFFFTRKIFTGSSKNASNFLINTNSGLVIYGESNI